MLTLGVEEEYLLIDPDTGLPVAVSEKVREAAGRQSDLCAEEIQQELLLAQLEIATPVCETLDEVGRHLRRLRRALGAAAAELGCRLVPCGADAFSLDLGAEITDKPRYHRLRERARQLVDEQRINGMHIHVAIPDRETGIGALNRLRPWLPVLVALAANSPVWQGEDTGFASWRTVIFGRWPISGPPPSFVDAPDYDRRVQSLIAAGAIADAGEIYWQARLSGRYPTLELRAPDVQLRTQEAVMLAGLARGLVLTAAHEHRTGAAVPEVLPEFLAAATWHAARSGLDSTLIGSGGTLVPAAEAVHDLLEHVTPALLECGDAEQVGTLVEKVLAEGNGAQRQRRAMDAEGLPGLLGLLMTDTAEA